MSRIRRRVLEQCATRLAILVMACASVVTAQPRDVPDDVLVYYRLDTRSFDQQLSGIVPLLLQMAERSGFVDKGFHPLFDGLLAASVVGPEPHTLCLMDLDLVAEPGTTKLNVTELAAVLVIESDRDHRTYVQTLGTILQHYGREAKRDQTPFVLSNGRDAVRYKASTWQDWQTLEWASLGDAFIVGLGKDPIEQWLSMQTRIERSNGTLAGVPAHRTAVRRERGGDPGTSLLEAWVNLDRMRQRMPEILAQGRARDWLVAWQLDNARNWMFHASRKEKFLVADITWQRRSEPRSVVARREVTLDHWPEDLLLPVPPGGYVIVAPMQWEAAFQRVLDAYRATQTPARQIAFDEDLADHRRRYRADYARLWPTLQPYLIMSNHPKPPIAVPGATTIYFEVTKRASPRTVQRRIHNLMRDFMEGETPEKLGDAIVRFDADQQMYWLQLEHTGLLQTPAWGWAGRWLIGSWAPGPVLENRAWLTKP